MAIVRSSAGDDRLHVLAIGAGGGDVGEPIGLGQPVLAGLAVGDGDAEERLLGLDPGLALGAHRVQGDPAVLGEIAGADLARGLEEGRDQIPRHLRFGQGREDGVHDLLLGDGVEIARGQR